MTLPFFLSWEGEPQCFEEVPTFGERGLCCNIWEICGSPCCFNSTRRLGARGWLGPKVFCCCNKRRCGLFGYRRLWWNLRRWGHLSQRFHWWSCSGWGLLGDDELGDDSTGGVIFYGDEVDWTSFAEEEVIGTTLFFFFLEGHVAIDLVVYGETVFASGGTMVSAGVGEAKTSATGVS